MMTKCTAKKYIALALEEAEKAMLNEIEVTGGSYEGTVYVHCLIENVCHLAKKFNINVEGMLGEGANAAMEEGSNSYYSVGG